ncbi:MAG: substrate-binding domain-containing protein [Suipraeoptans sp.]
MKKIRLLVLLLTAVVLCSLFTSCKKNVGTPEDNAVSEKDTQEEVDSKEKEEEENDQILIGYSISDMSNPFFATIESAIKEETDKMGYELITKDPANDQDVQLAQIQEMIEAGVDIVILSPVDYEKVTPTLKALSDAKVKVINVYSRVKDNQYTEGYIGSDNAYAGNLCGEKIIEDMPNGGNIAILEYRAQSAVTDVVTSFEETISKAEKGFEVIGREDANGSKETAYNATKELFNTNPDIEVLMCGNDTMAIGALQAVNELGKNESVKIYSIGGSPDIKTLINDEGSAIVATVALSPINIGKSTFEVLQDILNKKTFESEVKESVYLITKENVDIYGIDGWQ